MNRTLLLAGVAATLFAVNANAMDFDQYISAKGAFVKMENDADVNSHYSFSGMITTIIRFWTINIKMMFGELDWLMERQLP